MQSSVTSCTAIETDTIIFSNAIRFDDHLLMANVVGFIVIVDVVAVAVAVVKILLANFHFTTCASQPISVWMKTRERK